MENVMESSYVCEYESEKSSPCCHPECKVAIICEVMVIPCQSTSHLQHFGFC